MRNRDIWKTAPKRWEKKKFRIFNFLGGFSRKKIIKQSNLKHKQTFWKMAADNDKTAFRLPSGVKEDFTGI